MSRPGPVAWTQNLLSRAILTTPRTNPIAAPNGGDARSALTKPLHGA
jgi:hypothetical protein